MPASSYLRGKVIDHTLRAVTYPAPSAVYVSLHTSDPTINGTPATEVSAGWYARQTLTLASQTIAGQTSNSNTVTYNGVTGSSATVTHFAIWDASTLGNMLYFGPLSSAKTFNLTDVPSWLPGQLAVTAT